LNQFVSHILLVEDTPELAQAIIKELEAAGYSTEHVLSGEAALRLCADKHFNLIILDWMLPGIDGLEVLRRVRSQSPVPVLMLTARDDEFDRVMGLEVGADDYLTKPFSMRELVARVRAMLRRRALIEQTLQEDAHPNAQRIVFDALVIDPQTYTLTIVDEIVDLTRREFDLLYLLARNPGRVFSRLYLLDTVWSADYVEGDRAVDNAVLRLRRKLRESGDKIETVWGVGYRWQRV
jgi:DNA-binding response OmpR family regulator